MRTPGCYRAWPKFQWETLTSELSIKLPFFYTNLWIYSSCRIFHLHSHVNKLKRTNVLAHWWSTIYSGSELPFLSRTCPLLWKLWLLSKNQAPKRQWIPSLDVFWDVPFELDSNSTYSIKQENIAPITRNKKIKYYLQKIIIRFRRYQVSEWQPYCYKMSVFCSNFLMHHFFK